MGMRRSVTAAALAGLVLLVVSACGRTEEPPPAAQAPAAQVPAPAAQAPAAQAPAPAATQPAPAAQPAARPAPAPGPVREAERSPYGFYTIQLSSWRNLDKAQAEARRWQGKGLEAYVLRSEIPGEGTWYRVRAGRYPGYSVALQAMRTLIGVDDPRVWVDNYTEPGPLR